MLNCLDRLAATEMFEIVPDRVGNYDQSCRVSLNVHLPRYLDCNYDVYSLVIGWAEYYLLPDCVLMHTEGGYYALKWSQVSVQVDNINVNLKYTKYQTVMVHGRIRQDGGVDQRYNTRYAQVPCQALRRIDDGIISLRFGDERYVILSDGPHVVQRFEAVFAAWKAVQK
jgi:hypothetical protein